MVINGVDKFDTLENLSSTSIPFWKTSENVCKIEIFSGILAKFSEWYLLSDYSGLK